MNGEERSGLAFAIDRAVRERERLTAAGVFIGSQRHCAQCGIWFGRGFTHGCATCEQRATRRVGRTTSSERRSG